MYCINYFNKSCLAVNFSDLSVSNIMVAQGLDNSTDNTRMAHWFNPDEFFTLKVKGTNFQ